MEKDAGARRQGDHLVGGRSPNGLRKFLSAALRQSKGDSPQGSTSPETGDMKAVAENAQLRTKFERRRADRQGDGEL